ncbi:MAG: hypothetical protein HC821_02185 [Lewinella sp.]|nr:hypothetical protein [Lewinella sp.]
MELHITFAFNDFSLRNKLIDIIRKKFTFKRIEIEQDFKWSSIDNFGDLIKSDFTQSRFSIKKGGDRILIQNLNNSLPRLIGVGLDKISTEIFNK